MWDPKSCRERTDLPVWPSAHTEQRQKWKEREQRRGNKKRGESRGSYCAGPPGQRKRERGEGVGYRERDGKMGHIVETFSGFLCKKCPRR